jgi:hypothetical protein
LLDRFFHRRRQVSPVVKYLTHRFFDGYYHLLDGNLAWILILLRTAGPYILAQSGHHAMSN